MDCYKNIINPAYTLSSWNYGAYSQNNPYYAPPSVNNNMVKTERRNFNKNNQINQYGKRILREEEKIVTNEYMENINHMKKMEKEEKNGMFRAKSANAFRCTKRKNSVSQKENNSKVICDEQITTTKTDTSNFKYRLTYGEWLAVKKKQAMIFNQIKKIKEEEELKAELTNKKVDKKYKEIKEQRFKEWLDKKNKDFRKRKEEIKREELIKEEEKKEKEKEKEEKMNLWFKEQAKKMESEILQKREEQKEKEELELQEKENKKKKRQESREKFNQWKKKKDLEIKERKKLEKMSKETESRSKYSTRVSNRMFPIGPYSDAGALKEIQKFVAEKCTEEDNEEEGVVINNNNNDKSEANQEKPKNQEQVQENFQEINNNNELYQNRPIEKDDELERTDENAHSF